MVQVTIAPLIRLVQQFQSTITQTYKLASLYLYLYLFLFLLKLTSNQESGNETLALS